MNNKKIKLLSGIALGFIALSLLYTLCLLLTGTYGDSIIKQPSTGDTSQDLGASIGYACTTGIHLVTITFGLIVKAVALAVGFSSCFTKRKKSVITAAVFACILALLSAVISAFALSVYPEIASGNFNSVLCYIAFICMPLSDLFLFVVSILRAVYLAKQDKKAKEEKQEVVN